MRIVAGSIITVKKNPQNTEGRSGPTSNGNPSLELGTQHQRKQ